MAASSTAANMHMCSLHAASHTPLRLQRLGRAVRQSHRVSRQHRCAASQAETVDDRTVSTSVAGCDAEGDAWTQLRLLRTCGSTLAVLGALTALLHSDAALAADPSDLSQHHHAANAVFDLAGEDDFWGNVGAYMRFFVTVMLGTVNVVSQPFRKAAKRPGTAIALVLGGVALFAFMAVTVKMMLGIGGEDFDYLTRGV